MDGMMFYQSIWCFALGIGHPQKNTLQLKPCKISFSNLSTQPRHRWFEIWTQEKGSLGWQKGGGRKTTGFIIFSSWWLQPVLVLFSLPFGENDLGDEGKSSICQAWNRQCLVWCWDVFGYVKQTHHISPKCSLQYHLLFAQLSKSYLLLYQKLDSHFVDLCYM